MLTIYALLAACNISTLYDNSRGTTIETHVYNSSVTLCLAAVYVVVGYIFQWGYRFLTNSRNQWNPDLDSYGLRTARYRHMPDSGKSNEMTQAVAAVDDVSDMDPEQPTVPLAQAQPDDLSGVDREECGDDGNYGKMSDLQFMVQVYLYGITIFVIYYAMDMAVLAPSISLLSGFIVLSFGEIYHLLTVTIVPEDLLLAKTMTMLSLALTLVSIAELLASTMDITENDAWPRETLASVTFTYVLPYFACFTIGILPRSCSKSIVIRRAMPSAVGGSLAIVVLVQSINMVVKRYEQSLFNAIEDGVVWDDPDLQSALHDLSLQDLALYDLNAPQVGPPSVTMIVLMPMLKLAMTLGVITSCVNRKTTEIAAFLAFLTGLKELHVQSAPDSREHVIRATVIAACATVFSAVRYCRQLVKWVLR